MTAFLLVGIAQFKNTIQSVSPKRLSLSVWSMIFIIFHSIFSELFLIFYAYDRDFPFFDNFRFVNCRLFVFCLIMNSWTVNKFSKIQMFCLQSICCSNAIDNQPTDKVFNLNKNLIKLKNSFLETKFEKYSRNDNRKWLSYCRQM